MNKTWFQKLFRHDPPADSGRRKTGPFPDNADMQFARAVNCDIGAGETQDDTEAAKWDRKAAEQGYALAHFNLPVMYDQGPGGASDQAEAPNWFRSAAEQGEAGAPAQL